MAERRHHLGLRLFGLLAGLLAGAPSLACGPAPAAVERVALAGMLDRGDFALADGRRLAPAGTVEPDSGLARAVALEALGAWRRAAGGIVLLSGPEAPDRWGRLRADLAPAGGAEVSFAVDLVRRGARLADLAALPGNCRNLFLEAEERARRARAGFWGDPEAGPVAAAALQAAASRAGRFAVMEGRVTHVGIGRRAVFLNFGRRGQAASIEMPMAAWRELARQGWTVERLRGRDVRARGVILQKDVPRMLLRSAAAMEITG